MHVKRGQERGNANENVEEKDGKYFKKKERKFERRVLESAIPLS